MLTFIEAAVAAMLTLAPPGRSLIPDARESAVDGEARYVAIAAAALEAAKGDEGAATLLLGFSWMESGWRRDVDLGVGPLARGGGRDSCLMQLRATDEEHAWLVKDRVLCFRAGLVRLRQSAGACRRNSPDERWAAYTAGRCGAGLVASRARAAAVRRVAGLIAAARAGRAS